MQKKAKIIALVTALVFLLGGVVPVVAADGTKSIQALFKNIKIMANGSQLISDQEPFMVDGRVFVPIRVVAEATGASVDWDGTGNRVLITTKPTIDQAELNKKYQEGYTAGQLDGYYKGLTEGKAEVESKEDKRKEYDQGYRAGEAKGEKEGYDAGRDDSDRNKRSDWSNALPSDSSISRNYNLSNKSSDYLEGFLDGFKDQFKDSYRDGYDRYDNYYDDGYEDGRVEGYYDGYDRGQDDSNYNYKLPTDKQITDQYKLNNETRSYRDDFLDGYRDGYRDGYDDGYDDLRKNPDRYRR